MQTKVKNEASQSWVQMTWSASSVPSTTSTTTSISNVSNVNHNPIKTIVQYYMPPENQMNKDFLRQVLAEEKQLLKKNQVQYITVAKHDEISVKNLWKELRENKAFSVYFNDSYPEDKAPNRDYFFNIMNTVYPDYLFTITDHASKQRHTTDGADNEAKGIKTSLRWQEELKSMPFTSSKYNPNIT